MMNNYGKTWLTGLVLALAILAIQTIFVTQPAQAAGPWYVGPGGSDSNDCTSPITRCASINGALAKPGFVAGDIIYVAVGTYTGSGDEVILLDQSATISGGWNSNFTTQNGMSTINGENLHRGITVNSGVMGVVERFIVQNGYTDCNGSGVYNEGNFTSKGSIIRENTAGGIYCLGMAVMNTRVMTLNNTIVSGNEPAGGIYNENGTLILNSSTISGNTTSDAWNGGGITNWDGSLTLNNSTISGNTTSRMGPTGSSGGGIYNGGNGTMILNNSTVSGNTASGDGFQIDGGDGGGIYNGSSGSVTLQNTILAGNTASGIGSDCNGTIGSSGYNLVGDISGCTFASATGDLTNTDPELSPLEDNGGATETHALLAGSPAMNAGNPAGCTDNLGNPLFFDQRGMPRVGRCDIGAYEVGLAASKHGEGTFSPGGLVTYTITIGNEEGITNLSDVFVSDILPSYHSYVPDSFTATNGTGGESNGIITWSGTVFATTDTSITFNAVISDSIPQGIIVTNTAVISSSGVAITRQARFDTFARIYLPIIHTPCGNYFDDFSNPNSGWSVVDDSSVRSEYLNDEYRILSKQSGLFFLFRTPTCQRQNYIVETDARWVGAPGSGYGLLFGIKDSTTNFFNQYYLFDINTDFRQFRLLRRNADGGFSTIVSPTSAPTINGGTASNHLKATRNGNQITLEVNGSVLGTWFDGTIIGLTDAGLVTNPYSYNPTSDARFDNFSINVLPGSSSTSIQGLNSTAIGVDNSQLSGANRTQIPADIPGWSSQGD